MNRNEEIEKIEKSIHIWQCLAWVLAGVIVTLGVLTFVL